MRSILLLTVLVPVLGSAQINRSARELASETIGQYITTRLFKNQAYEPISFGKLREMKDYNSDIIWTFDHKFRITEKKRNDKEKPSMVKTYNFTFYLDREMRVKLADGSFYN